MILTSNLVMTTLVDNVVCGVFTSIGADLYKLILGQTSRVQANEMPNGSTRLKG